MPYDNMPFKNKQAAKSDRTGMSAGPGDPPKKKSSDDNVSVYIRKEDGPKRHDKYKDFTKSDRTEISKTPGGAPKKGQLGYKDGSFTGNYIRK